MPDEPEDTELENLLRQAAARFDPVPPHLLRAAEDSFTWRTVDADLAELVFDSLVDQDQESLVRGPEQGRLLSFETTGLTIEVEISGSSPERRLIGQLIPPQRAAVELRGATGAVTLQADELGRFSAGSVPPGAVSLRCSSASGGRSVVTDWVTI